MISSDEDKGCLLAPARFVCCLMKRENVLLCMKTMDLVNTVNLARKVGPSVPAAVPVGPVPYAGS